MRYPGKIVDSFLIDRLSFEGNDKFTRAYLKGKLRYTTEEYTTFDKINQGMSNLAATNNFNSVRYELRPNKEGYQLTVPIVERHTDMFLKLGVHYDGLYKTNHAISGMHQLMGSLESGAVAMYALEKEIPKISQIKLEGLAEFYGLTSEDVTKYFKEHMEADIRHAASWQKIIEQKSEQYYLTNVMINAAESSVTCQNLLLDSCYEEYC